MELIELVFRLVQLAVLLPYLFIRLMFNLALGPWTENPKDAARMNFRSIELLLTTVLAAILNLLTYLLLRDSKYLIAGIATSTLLAVTIFFHALYLLSRCGVSDFRRRTVSFIVTFPLTYISIITVFVSTYFSMLEFGTGSPTWYWYAILCLASLGALAGCRKLSRWALRPTVFIDLTEELSTPEDPKSPDH